ncbi:hypothetical protein Syun_007793 [Stephania yunnanensis]|uniref:Flavin-containing monooxygenase n=1 Tax=Stephania yunnanensis TaxID=152371 RepID=A0AAP0PYU5_9MAGN
MTDHEETVIVVGAGPSGIATSACLNNLSIPNTVLEREDCFASLWKKKSYDRLHLHLAKKFCELPHMPFPPSSPTYISRKQFINYIDEYVSHFRVRPLYNRLVESATFDRAREGGASKLTTQIEAAKRFLVVASGETSDAYVPDVEGLETFFGEVIHSTEYKSGEKYKNKRALVVGSGNSGMEIALDLSNFDSAASIVVRSPVHVVSREMASLGLVLLKHLPLKIVDGLLVILSKLVYGRDLSKYGINRPKEGPFFMKLKYGKYPVIDVGTINKIKSSKIQVVPSITRIRGKEVEFSNGKSDSFDVLIFATGFKRSTNKWLKANNGVDISDNRPDNEINVVDDRQTTEYKQKQTSTSGREHHGAVIDSKDNVKNKSGLCEGVSECNDRLFYFQGHILIPMEKNMELLKIIIVMLVILEILLLVMMIPLTGPNSIVGRAVVVHADPDDLGKGNSYFLI